MPWVEGANSVVFCNDGCCLWIRTGDDVAKDTRFQFASTVVSDGLSGSATCAAHVSLLVCTYSTCAANVSAGMSITYGTR